MPRTERTPEEWLEIAKTETVWDAEMEEDVLAYNGHSVLIGQGDDVAEYSCGFEVIHQIESWVSDLALRDDAEDVLSREEFQGCAEGLPLLDGIDFEAYDWPDVASSVEHIVASGSSWGGDSPGRSGVYMEVRVKEEVFVPLLTQLREFEDRLGTHVVHRFEELGIDDWMPERPPMPDWLLRAIETARPPQKD